MPSDDEYKSPQDFLKKMDAGDYDGRLLDEIKKLTHEQLTEVAGVLMERDAQRRRLHP